MYELHFEPDLRRLSAENFHHIISQIKVLTENSELAKQGGSGEMLTELETRLQHCERKLIELRDCL